MVKVLSILLLIGILAAVFVPSFAYAQATKPEFTNPLGTDSLTELLVNVIRWLLGLVGFLALLALVVGGIRLIISLGNERNVEHAKQIIYWAVAGLAVVILAYAIISIVQGALGVTVQ